MELRMGGNANKDQTPRSLPSSTLADFTRGPRVRDIPVQRHIKSSTAGYSHLK